MISVKAETIYSHKHVIEKFKQDAYEEQLLKEGKLRESELQEMKRQEPEKFEQLQQRAEENDMVLERCTQIFKF